MIEQAVSRVSQHRNESRGDTWQTAGHAYHSWMVQCDFDGTISLRDVTDTLLERFGKPGWRELEERWENGEIGSRECMRGQIALLDMSLAELHAHLATIEIDPHFVGFVNEAQRQGLPVQVVSDGMDYVIRFILERHGLGNLPVMANRLVHTGDRSWKLESPYASDNCTRASGTCKCERMAEQRKAYSHVLFVGDSTSDFCVSGKADFVLAKSRLIDYCEERGISHAPIADFSVATELLSEIVEPMRVRV